MSFTTILLSILALLGGLLLGVFIFFYLHFKARMDQNEKLINNLNKYENDKSKTTKKRS